LENSDYRIEVFWLHSVDNLSFIVYSFYFSKGEFETNYPGTTNPWEGQAKNEPFDKDFYFVLNNACGGTA
jgi:hypothetical protein